MRKVSRVSSVPMRCATMWTLPPLGVCATRHEQILHGVARPHGALAVAHVAEGRGGRGPGEERGGAAEADAVRELRGRDGRRLEALAIAVDVEQHVPPERRLREGLRRILPLELARPTATFQSPVTTEATRPVSERSGGVICALREDEPRAALAAEPGLLQRIAHRLPGRRDEQGRPAGQRRRPAERRRSAR